MTMRRNALPGPFAACPWLFQAALLGLLLFFAVAAVHQAAPGLCNADTEIQGRCPFCELLFTLVVAIAIFIFTIHREIPRMLPAPPASAPPRKRRHTPQALRAPPAIPARRGCAASRN